MKGVWRDMEGVWRVYRGDRGVWRITKGDLVDDNRDLKFQAYFEVADSLRTSKSIIGCPWLQYVAHSNHLFST